MKTSISIETAKQEKKTQNLSALLFLSLNPIGKKKRRSTMRLTQTLFLSIALETGFALARIMGRQVAALGVLHAFSRQFRILAFVDI